MAGSSYLVANPTPNPITVGTQTLEPGAVGEVAAPAPVVVTLTAPTGVAAITSLTVAALAAQVVAGSFVTLYDPATEVSQTFIASATAAAAAVTIDVDSATPVESFPVTSKGSAVAPANLEAFVAAGCAVASAVVPAGDVLDSPVQLAEKGARLLGSLARAVVSASADPNGFAEAGL